VLALIQKTGNDTIRRRVMTEVRQLPKVGAPDPELKNSPIFDDTDADELSLDLELESGVCHFNNIAYAIGDYVCSGDEMLRCEERGVWIREGSCRQSI
jgi:hypothetical protein